MVSISVIIPVFNAEKTITKCLDSIIDQTFKDYEVIIVNDGSSDQSFEIIEKYRKNNSSIKVINKKNEGVSKARNYGISNSIGKYLFFIDADDWIENNTFEVLNDCIEKSNPDLICFNSVIEHKESREINNKIKTNIFIDMEKEEVDTDQLSISFIWDKLFKRKIIIENNNYFENDLSYGEDTLFYCKYFSKIKNISLLKYNLYHYRKNNNNSLSSKYVDNMDEVLQMIYLEHLRIYNKYPFFKSVVDKNLYYEVSCVQVIYNLYNNNCKLTKIERREKLKNYFQNNMYDFILKAKPKSFFKKIIVWTYITKNAYVMDYTLSILKNIRNLVLKIKRIKLLNQ